MFKSIITAIALSAAAAPAFANDQFAKSIGVEPGVYSLSTMIQIDQAQKENDRATLAHLLKRKIDAQVSRSTTFDGQLAASAGASGSSLSANELVQLNEALEDVHSNPERVDFIRNGGSDGAVHNDRGVVTGAKVQLAAPLGVDPAAYTTAELSTLAAKKFNSDNNK